MTPHESHTATSQTAPGAGAKGFWAGVAGRFRKRAVNRWASRYLILMAFVAVFADGLAYDKPLVCNRGEGIEFPVLGDYLITLGFYQRKAELIHADWHELQYNWAIWPPVPYSPEAIDYQNQRLTSPFGKQEVPGWWDRHHLGTNRDGRDVLSGLIHGTRISLSIGIVAMGISALIGMLLGAFAGFFGDNRLRLSRAGIGFSILGLVLGYFYGFQVRSYVFRDALASGAFSFLWQLALGILIMVAIVVVMVQLSRPFNRIPWLGKQQYIWVDVILSRLLEIMMALPLLLLIITLMSMVEKKSIYYVMVIIGLVGWIGVARFTRAEMLRTRSMPFVEAARALGMPEWRVLLRHALPNSLAPVIVVITFGVAGAIASEAALSFLGVGVPDDVVTWGGLLREARSSQSAWWLVLFPSLTVFLAITALNLVGEGLRDALDPRQGND